MVNLNYYLTTRGLDSNNELYVLGYLPESFQEFITVVSSKENRKSILKKYPKVNYLISPDYINTASKKRKWLYETLEENRFFLINDDLKIYVLCKDENKLTYRSAKQEEKIFYQKIKELEALTKTYIGVSTAPKFWADTTSTLVENRLVCCFWSLNKKFALSKLKFARLDYHEDIDYSLQILSKGYKTVNYLGITMEPRSSKPKRQFIDRTLDVQQRDSLKLAKFFPNSVSLSKDFSFDTERSISIKWAAEYKPKRKILFVSSDKNLYSYFLSVIATRFKKSYDFKYAFNETSKSINNNLLLKFRSKEFICNDPKFIKISSRLLNWADDIIALDNKSFLELKSIVKDSDKLKSQFLKSQTVDSLFVESIEYLKEI